MSTRVQFRHEYRSTRETWAPFSSVLLYFCPPVKKFFCTLVLLSKSSLVLLSKMFSCTPVKNVLLYSCLNCTLVLLSKSSLVLLSKCSPVVERYSRLLFELGIADACVVDGLQLLYEYGLGVLDVAEGDGAVAEVALVNLRVDDAADEFADALFRIVGQRP